MKIGVIGAGYVFDHYMTTRKLHPQLEFCALADRDSIRAQQVGSYYNIPVRPVDEILSDPKVEIVANFTSIGSHYSVSLAALEAGKNVYSEKPLTATMDEARHLMEVAEARGLRISCAPSNVLSPTVQTLWAITDQGLIGDVRMVYAEFDDNPVYLMSPETWRSRSGAPWPYLHEYEMGCTWEHAGYHLAWMCALFGPVRSVSAFSKATLPDKTKEALRPPDTPDFSVATLDFESGVVGRLTCSIAAPTDHRMRIFGNRGTVSAETYRHYECPVFLERYTELSLKARNIRAVRTYPVLASMFGSGGRRVPLADVPHSMSNRAASIQKSWRPKALLSQMKRNQFGQQDKCLGLAELAEAISTGRQAFPSQGFTLHVTELTHAIQAAGPNGANQIMETRFEPISAREIWPLTRPDYQRYARPRVIPRILNRVLSGRGVRRG